MAKDVRLGGKGQIRLAVSNARLNPEECDGLKGFHFMLDLQSAFGNIACSLLESIDHE